MICSPMAANMEDYSSTPGANVTGNNLMNMDSNVMNDFLAKTPIVAAN